MVKDSANNADYAMFAITGAHSYSSPYLTVPVSYLSGATSFNPSQNVILTFAVTGDRGDVGYTGSVGSAGYNGSQGIAGYTGSKGDTGFTGSQGVIGYTGSKGDQGNTGYVGSIGATGTTGYVGSTGNQGNAGFTGSIGSSGYTGSTGLSGYTGSKGDLGYTGSIGFSGSQGINGYVGSKGDQGIGYTGSVGAVGYTGSIGITGDTGYTGSQGIQGNTGYIGSIGATGYVGSIGATGAVGYTGSKGDQGVTGYIGSTGQNGATGYTGSIGATGGLGYTGSTGTFASGQNIVAGNITINGTLTTNGTSGSPGQALYSNGIGVYWANTPTTVSYSNVTVTTITANSLSADAINIGKGFLTVGNSTVNTQITNSSIITLSITANGTTGVAGSVLTSNGNGMYWSNAVTTLQAQTITAGTLAADSMNIGSGWLTVGNSTVNTVISNTGVSTNYLSVQNINLLSSVASFNTYSSYLGSSSTYVSFPSVSLNSSTMYCMEFFVKFTSLSSSDTTFFGDPSLGAGNQSIAFSTTGITLINPGYTSNKTNFTLANGTWYHIAYIGTGSIAYWAVNGVVKSTGFGGGFSGYSGTTSFPVYKFFGPATFSNFRIVTGSSVYNTTSLGFSPPATSLSPVSGTYLLTLQDPIFKDNSGSNRTITTSGSPSLAPDNITVSSSGTLFSIGSIINGNLNLPSIGTNYIYANNALGTTGQILTSNSSGGIYWSNSSASYSVTANVITANTLSSDYINIGIGYLTVGNSTVNTQVTNSSIIIKSITANGSVGSPGQFLVSNGTGMYWTTSGTTGYTGSAGVGYTGSVGSTGGTGYTGSIGYTGSLGYTGSQGSFANGSSASVNNFTVTGTFTANGVTGTSGQTLTANATGGLYWSNSSTSYSVTSNVVTSNIITTNTLTSDFINIGIGNLTVGNSTSNSVLANTGLIVSNILANTVYGVGITANNTLGSAGQVLASNGSGIYWTTVTGGSGGSGNYKFTSSNTAPSSPSVGDRWYNTDYGIELVFVQDPNGAAYQWVDMSSGGQTGATGPIGYTGSQGAGYTGSIGSIGYTGSQGASGATIPATTQSGNYTLQSSDNGNLIVINTGNTTVPAGVFTAGQNVTIFNNNAASMSIIQGSGVTMYYVSSTTGTRTLGGYGLTTVLSINSTTFVITGGVLT